MKSKLRFGLLIIVLMFIAAACANPFWNIPETDENNLIIHAIEFDLGSSVVKIYGDTFTNTASHPGTGSVSYFSGNEEIAVADEDTGEVIIIAAGEVEITAVKTADDTYAQVQASYTLTVNKALLTITADGFHIGYLETPPDFTFTADGFLNEDDESVLSGAPEYECNYEPGDPNGPYTITIAQGELAAANYNFSFIDGELFVGIINQAELIIDDPGELTYGDADFTLAATGGSVDSEIIYEIVSGEDVISINGDTVKILKAGTAEITALNEGNENYYPVTSEPLIITINKRNMSNVSIEVDRSYTYTGSEHTPIPLVEDRELIAESDYILSYSNNINAGYYAIVTVAAAEEGNYIGSKNCYFDIEPAIPDFDWPQSGTINYGAALSASTLTDGRAEFNGEEIPGTFTWTNDAVIPIVMNGGYLVTFTPTNNPNIRTYSQYVDITVLPRPITVTVSAPSRTLIPFNSSCTRFGNTATVNITISGLLVSDTAAIRVNTNSNGISGSANIGATGTLTVSYNGNTSTATGIGIPLAVSGNYSLSNTPTVYYNIRDGITSARAIPITEANINAFNTYANGTTGRIRHYRLEENITLSGNWTPIGTGPVYLNQTFGGSFDGNGYTISNLRISSSAADYQGMFGSLLGTVRNLGLIDVNINGRNYTGGITGLNQGTIQESYVTGSITGSENTGGIAGYNGSLIRDCYSFVTVSGTAMVGGITGANWMYTLNCYSAGSVTGTGWNVGGIAGLTDNAVQNCVALNTSVRTAIGAGVARIMGREDGGSSYNNYARNDMILQRNWNGTTGTTQSVFPSSWGPDGLSLRAAQAHVESWWKTESNWNTDSWAGSVPWDFTNVWVWNSVTRLPVLRRAGGEQDYTARLPVDIEMVWIPAGTFMMGSPSTEAGRNAVENYRTANGGIVTVNGFWMGNCQVTQEQYQKVMGNNPSEFQDNPAPGEIQERRPVERVSWYDAIVFCNRLSIMEELTPAYRMPGYGNSTDPEFWISSNSGNIPTSSNATWNAVQIVPGSTGYRLPTEAQWEYACRAGTTTAYNNNSNDTSVAVLGEIAWFSGNSNSRTHEVGLKTSNTWGLYDMHGNVWEWCWDWYNASYNNAGGNDNPLGAVSGTARVARGGSWSNSATSPRSAGRTYYNPYYRNYNFGFRLVRP
ncbi:MAG: SUMF1/EgtB/PvdO family nonheme iron enzyme [Treponema sp.]|nr:SUMF1/EgtB/PvdO family nonheme iron enzyme [Treponema sp.]